LRWRRRANHPQSGLRKGLEDCGPDVAHEILHPIDIGGVGQQAEKHHAKRLRARIRAARAVIFDIGGVRNHHAVWLIHLLQQPGAIGGAAQIDTAGLAIDAEFLNPQLAPVDGGIEAAQKTAV